MYTIIMAGIVILVVLFPILTIGAVMNSKKPYVCPNCGHRFTKKWYRLIFKSGPMVRVGNGELRLRCPSCKKTDFCLHTNEIENSR